MSVVSTLRVRYAECDSQGVVFNANYLAYFDLAISELFRAAFGSYQSVLDRGIDLVVAEANLRYRGPARFDDELALEVSVTRLGTTSLATRYRVVRGADLLVEGDMRHVAVDRVRLAARARDPKTRIPGWMRDALGPYVEPA